MRKLGLALIVLGCLTLAACNGTPTVVVVVTSTPDPHIIQVTVTSPQTNVAAQPSALPTSTQKSKPTQTVANVAATPIPTNTSSVPQPTQVPSNFPTETKAELYIAQEDFEHGYMFWISSIKKIWVLYESPNNPNAGEWQSYSDDWVQGTDPENDPSLVPPTGLYAPVRGFLKLWSKTSGMRDALGWGKTPEFALNTTYVYQPGGSVDASGNYIQGPGKHFVTALSRDVYAMTEPEPGQARGTWEKVS